VPETKKGSVGCSCALAREAGAGQAYNEDAFRYFLDIERKRSELFGRPFLMLLVDLKEQAEMSARIEPAVAAKLFSGLWLCLRETDFIGWWREGRAVGAVLTQHAEISIGGISQHVREKVTRVLNERLPNEVAARLQVRVFQLPPSSRDRSC